MTTVKAPRVKCIGSAKMSHSMRCLTCDRRWQKGQRAAPLPTHYTAKA